MLTINAQLRDKKGKSFSRKLRFNNQFPGVLYGIDKSNILLTLDHNAIFNLQMKVDFYKNYLCLIVKDQKYKVKVQDVQRHAFKLKLLHIDFLFIK